MIPGINNSTDKAARQMQAQLVSAGYKITLPRQQVLRQVAAQGPSFTASQLLDAVVLAAPNVGRATVFRTLDLLVELGIIQRVHTEASGSWGSSYVICGLGDEHHHHLVCTRCGKIDDLAGCLLDPLLADLEANTSFRVEGHHLELYGTCGQCQTVNQEKGA
jgi:Fur family ferric uptake transcriptional regulator